LLFVVPRELAAISIRPVDESRLAGPNAYRDRQCDRYSGIDAVV